MNPVDSHDLIRRDWSLIFSEIDNLHQPPVRCGRATKSFLMPSGLHADARDFRNPLLKCEWVEDLDSKPELKFSVNSLLSSCSSCKNRSYQRSLFSELQHLREAGMGTGRGGNQCVQA